MGAAAAAVGKKCKRADDIWNHESIIQDVVSLICKSSVVICDLTGKNANVFYEAGIAHCLGKDVILITQSAELGEMLKLATGIDIVHVPYRGAAAAATDVIAGQLPMTFGSFPGLMPFVRTGQLRVLGVCTEKRTQLAPDLPTLAETIPGLYANAWYGLFVPAGTPKDIIARLYSEISKVLESADMKERLAGLGVEPAPNTPDQLASLMQADLVRWGKIVKASGAHLD